MTLSLETVLGPSLQPTPLNDFLKKATTSVTFFGTRRIHNGENKADSIVLDNLAQKILLESYQLSKEDKLTLAARKDGIEILNTLKTFYRKTDAQMNFLTRLFCRIRELGSYITRCWDAGSMLLLRPTIRERIEGFKCKGEWCGDDGGGFATFTENQFQALFGDSSQNMMARSCHSLYPIQRSGQTISVEKEIIFSKWVQNTTPWPSGGPALNAPNLRLLLAGYMYPGLSSAESPHARKEPTVETASKDLSHLSQEERATTLTRAIQVINEELKGPISITSILPSQS